MFMGSCLFYQSKRLKTESIEISAVLVLLFTSMLTILACWLWDTPKSCQFWSMGCTVSWFATTPTQVGSNLLTPFPQETKYCQALHNPW